MRTLSLLALLVTALPVFAQRDAKVPDPDPEIERKTFILPPGFEVNLFAVDPMLAKPIHMNFDAQGRLWVASSEVYPQIEPGKKVNDRVLILEDTKGTGVADKTTVFADGLLIPTGVAPGDGGAYVADSTDLVHFSDPDPVTGKARKKRIVLSGFGTEDTHHILHTFRWGPDGCLYMNQSIYIHSHIETPHGVKRLNAGGIWRFRPETVELDVVARGFVNSWGHVFDRWGQTFATDGAYGEGINILMPGAFYVTNGYGVKRELQGLNPGSPKHCGLAVLSGRHLPEDYQGNMVTNDFRGHRVCRFALREDGSGYQSVEKQEIIKSNHPAFRPIDVAMGPDGAIYVADWYNPIIQHGEVDFRDPRRDHTHGRIWRITAKGRPLVEKPKLVGATIPELLEQLKAPEDFTRQMAKQVLKERGAKAVFPELMKWVAKLDRKDANFEHHRLEALWVYQTLNTVEPKLLEQVLNSPDHRARAAACRVVAAWASQRHEPALSVRLDREKMATLGVTAAEVAKALADYEAKPGATDEQWKRVEITTKEGQKVPVGAVARFEREATGLSNPLELLAPRVTDDHPQVRLDAVRALGVIPKVEAAALAAKALDKPMDKWLDYGLWLLFRELAPQWLPEVQAGKLDFGGDPKKLVFALQATGSNEVAKPLLALIKLNKVAKDREADVWLLVAQHGNPAELGEALTHAADAATQPQLRDAITSTIEEAVRQRRVAVPKNAHTVLFDLMARGRGGAGRYSALRLIGLWKVESLRDAVQAIPTTESPREELQAAFECLALLGGPKSRAALEDFTATHQTLANRQLAVIALASLDLPAAARKAVDLMDTAVTSPDLIDLFAAFVNRKSGPAELAKALAGKTIPADAAKLGIRAARATGQPDAKLVEALTKAGGLTDTKRVLSGKDLEQFVTDVAKLGDPARGEKVYRRTDMACLKCHAIAGAGGLVGPDMSSLGASAPVDYLVEALLNPNAKVKEGYNSFIVTTVDDRVITGVKVREDGKELVLRDNEDREVVIPKADIATRKDGKSLMPEGQTDPLTRQELLDLTRFLSELGKGQYAATPGKAVRRWQVLEPTQAARTLANRDRLAALTTAPNLTWSPAYSLVSGDLPLMELSTIKGHATSPPVVLVRFQIEVTTAGKVKIVLNDHVSAEMWLNGNPLEHAKEVTLDLPIGVHTVTVGVNVAVREKPLRVELDEVPGSSARARVLSGK